METKTRKIGGHVSCSGGLQNAVTNTLSIGGNCMQIFAGSPRMWTRSPYPSTLAALFKASVLKHDLNPVYIHALYLTNLASDNPELLAKSQAALILDMQNCAAIGASGVVLHIGSHQGRGWEHDRAQVIASIQAVLDSTPPTSILLLENSAGQQGKIGAFPELSDILGAIQSSRLKICLDTAHAFEAGYNFQTVSGLDMWLDDIEKTIGFTKLELLHLNDSKTPLGSGRDNHQNIGDGFIGTDALARLINHSSLAHLPLILEVPGSGSGPDKINIDRVKNLM